MKVTLDLTRLLAEGKITQDEYAKLSQLAHADTGSLAFNILVGLGIIAISAGALALLPNAGTEIVVGALLMAFGLFVLASSPPWVVLANMCLALAALMLGSGILVLTAGAPLAFLSIAALFLVSAVLARSGMLIVFGTLAVAGALGATTGYGHATYALSIEQPLLTIIVFGAIALATYHLSRFAGPAFGRLSLIAARTAVFLVNFGFWIGSLWGDPLTWLAAQPRGDTSPTGEPPAFLPPTAFALGWALALLGVGIWAARANRRWVVNLVAIFGAIHFYTQWFERLSATPWSVLMAGLVALTIALGLWKWNQNRKPSRSAASAG